MTGEEKGRFGRVNGKGIERDRPVRQANVINRNHKEIVMSFGLNRAQVIGRLGADAIVNHLASGGRVANLSIATDEGYIDKASGERRERTEWHRVVTFQEGLIGMLEKHARKGRLVYVEGKLQTRRWRKEGEGSDRYSTEIMLVPGGRVQFLDKPNGAPAPSAEPATAPAGTTPAGGNETPAANETGDDIPF